MTEKTFFLRLTELPLRWRMDNGIVLRAVYGKDRMSPLTAVAHQTTGEKFPVTAWQEAGARLGLPNAVVTRIHLASEMVTDGEQTYDHPTRLELIRATLKRFTRPYTPKIRFRPYRRRSSGAPVS